MTKADDLMRQANTLAEKIRRQRASSGGQTAGGDLAVMQTRLTSLWAAIRAARAGGPPARDEQPATRSRPKWD